MTDSAPGGNPYQLVSYQKHTKKACTDHAEQEEDQNKTETLLHIIFKKPMKSGTEINVAANVKTLLTTMTKADPSLPCLPLIGRLLSTSVMTSFPLMNRNSNSFCHLSTNQ